MFPLSSPPLPPHCSALFPPNTHLPPPPTNPSTFVSPLLLPPLPLPASLILSPPFFFPMEIVICKALCLDSPYLCRGVAASLSLSPFLSILHEVLAQTGTFSSCTAKTTRTTLKQQNLSPKEFRLSHAKPIFFTRLNKLPITK